MAVDSDDRSERPGRSEDGPGDGRWDDPGTTDWWQREFTDGVDPEYTEQIIPLIEDEVAGATAGLDRPAAVLDVGTGEGQVARALAHSLDGPTRRLVGFDPVRAQLATAAVRAGGPRYLQAAADAIPIRSASVDVAVACLVFEHIDAVDEAIGEVARVLRPGGRFVFLLNHPLLQTPGSGWIDDQILDPPEQYWRIGPYLPEASTVEEVQKGVHIRFVHRPLSRYLNALADAGLVLTRMHEPAPPPGFLAAAPEYTEAATVPRLAALVLTRA